MEVARGPVGFVLDIGGERRVPEEIVELFPDIRRRRLEGRRPREFLALEELPLREIGIIEHRRLLRENRAAALHHVDRVAEAESRRRIECVSPVERLVQCPFELADARLDKGLGAVQASHDLGRKRPLEPGVGERGLVEGDGGAGVACLSELVAAAQQWRDTGRTGGGAHAAAALSCSESKRVRAALISPTWSIAQLASPQIGFCSERPSSVSS